MSIVIREIYSQRMLANIEMAYDESSIAEELDNVLNSAVAAAKMNNEEA